MSTIASRLYPNHGPAGRQAARPINDVTMLTIKPHELDELAHALSTPIAKPEAKLAAADAKIRSWYAGTRR